MINWHRLFGMGLMDLFTDTGYTVELEKDLSLKQQFLDVIIIETAGPTHVEDLPDGLENLRRHNLLTYKSLRETLDAWALDELVGHYVNYRKQLSPGAEQLRPVEDFRLYAVSTRVPQNLLRDYDAQCQQAGVYDVQWGSQEIRIIVLGDMPKTINNAFWDLFSAAPEQVRYGAAHYHWRRPDCSTITNDLYAQYAREGMKMPYTIEDYKRDSAIDYFEEHKQEFLQRLAPADLLKVFAPADLLKVFAPDERLNGLSPEQIEAYLKKLREQHDSN